MAKKTNRKVISSRVVVSKGIKKTKELALHNNSAQLSMMNTSILRRQALDRLLNPGKDINYECGYPTTLSIDDYKQMWDREGLGARVVSFLPDESWSSEPAIRENEKTEDTEFEKKWKSLLKEYNIYHYLQRIDVLSGIGQFGILLIGVDDGLELKEPVPGIDLKTGLKTAGGKELKILYLRPFDESVIQIKKKESDITSPRFGFPTEYSIKFEDRTSQEPNIVKTQDTIVHWTRVIHITDNREVSEILGLPRMKQVFNRLLDVRKVLSGSGEMFWKGAFPGFSFEVNPDISDAEIDEGSMREELEAYSQGLQRYLAIAGVTVKALAPQVADPKGHIEAQVRYIAISLGVPYRIFIGTEEAKLASSQDMKTWNKRLTKRRDGYVSPMVIRPFVDRLIAFGTLPEVEEYLVEWPDLDAPSEEDQANVAKIRTEALKDYVQGDVHQLIPPKEYLMMFLGMSEEEVAAIETAVDEWVGLTTSEETEDTDTNTGGDDNDEG